MSVKPLLSRQSLRHFGLCLSSKANGGVSRTISTSTSAPGWLIPDVGKTAGHSSLVADKPDLYEIVVEDVKPEHWDQYLVNKPKELESMEANDGNKSELLASWKFIAGDVNFRAMHLYRFKEGWSDVDKTWKAMKADGGHQELIKANRKLLTRQTTEHLKTFSFWPEPDKRIGQNIYDVRSYDIKPGNMYDWSCYWSKGINIRKNVRQDIPYTGMFTQLGQLHTIYHIWCYSDLVDRRVCRQEVWNHQDWNMIVANTVPLVRTMKTRILEPLPFSPTK